MAAPTREEIKEAIGAAEARSDVKIARLEGKLDLVLAKIDDLSKDNVETRNVVRDDGRSIRNNMWAIGLGLGVLIVAIVTIFPSLFDLGAKFQSSIQQEIETQIDQRMPPRASTQPNDAN